MPTPNPMMVPKKRKRIKLDVNKEGLTDKQARFIQEYVTNGYNGTKAAIAAGYSKRSAQEIATENLRKPLIAQEKDRLMSKIADEAGCTKEFVMKRLKDGASLDLEGKAGQIAMKALELIGKHHGLFTEKTEMTIKSHEDWLDDIKDE